MSELLLNDTEIYHTAKSVGCQGLVSKNTYFAIIQIGRAIAKAQLAKAGKDKLEIKEVDQ